MAHEEQQHTSSSSSSKFAKKLKHKKVPQRGMGVAQLEKIISEDRQLKDADGVLKPNLIKFRRPAVMLTPPFPPNQHHLVSKADGSGSGNSFRRFYNFDGENLNQIQNRYLIGIPANQGGFRFESGSSIWAQIQAQRSQFQQPCSSSMVCSLSHS